jgi:hypothetical protein
MPEEYEEGTYLSEFTEAASGSAPPKSGVNTGVAAAGVGVSIFNILAALGIGALALLLALVAFPLAVVGIYLIGSFGGAAAQAATGNALVGSGTSPKHLWGPCPYCGHPRGAKRKEGNRLACGRCLNIFVIRGNRFYIPADRLKKFRRKTPAPAAQGSLSG